VGKPANYLEVEVEMVVEEDLIKICQPLKLFVDDGKE